MVRPLTYCMMTYGVRPSATPKRDTATMLG